MTDERRIVLLAAAGDDAAFAELVRRHQHYIVDIIRRSCGDRARAEDIAQLAFVKAWRSLTTLKDASAFRAWLRRIALNLMIDIARQRQPEPVDVGHIEAGGLADLDLLTKVDIASALQQLSIVQRTCVVLSFAEGMSHGEIAEELAMPLGTVKSHIARGLAVMRRLLAVEEQA